jgi:hypothetical protein
MKPLRLAWIRHVLLFLSIAAAETPPDFSPAVPGELDIAYTENFIMTGEIFNSTGKVFGEKDCRQTIRTPARD